MTSRYSETDWRDVLYTCVMKTPGSVADAAKFLHNRRGKSIHVEDLRNRLKGTKGEDVSVQIAQLLSEWMLEKEQSQKYALDWLHAFIAQFGLVAENITAEPVGGWPDEIQAIKDKALRLGAMGGELSQCVLDATHDGRIDPNEADALIAQAGKEIQMLHRLRRNVGRASKRARGG